MWAVVSKNSGHPSIILSMSKPISFHTSFARWQCQSTWAVVCSKFPHTSQILSAVIFRRKRLAFMGRIFLHACHVMLNRLSPLSLCRLLLYFNLITLPLLLFFIGLLFTSTLKTAAQPRKAYIFNLVNHFSKHSYLILCPLLCSIKILLFIYF